MPSERARSNGDKIWQLPTIIEGYGRHESQPISEADESTTGDLEESDKLRQPAELEPDGDYRREQREKVEVIRVGQPYPDELGSVKVKWHWIHLFLEQPCAKRFDLHILKITLFRFPV